MTVALLFVPALLVIGLSAAEPERSPAPPVAAAARMQARQRLEDGRRRMAEDRFNEAALAFEEAIALDPILAMARYGLGTARMGLKEYPAAVTAFEAAREAFHHWSGEAAENRIVTADRVFGARMRELEALIRTEPVRSADGRETGGQRGALEARMLDLMRLREESLRAPQLPPGFFLALGSAYFRTGRLADAEREYRAAIAAQPKLGEPRSNLGVVLLITGRPTEAKEQLELAKKTGFKPPRGLEDDIEKALTNAPPEAP